MSTSMSFIKNTSNFKSFKPFGDFVHSHGSPVFSSSLTQMQDSNTEASGFNHCHAGHDTKKQLEDRHVFYMYQFRTQLCPLFLNNHNCNNSKPYTCEFAHHEIQVRRKPIMTQDRWNYTSELCSYHSLLDCPQSSSCRKSHRIQQEHMYHPSTFKTCMCDSPLKRVQGPGSNSLWYSNCVSHGPHCVKAHADIDLRKPSTDNQSSPMKEALGINSLNDDELKLNYASPYSSSPIPDDSFNRSYSSLSPSPPNIVSCSPYPDVSNLASSLQQSHHPIALQMPSAPTHVSSHTSSHNNLNLNMGMHDISLNHPFNAANRHSTSQEVVKFMDNMKVPLPRRNGPYESNLGCYEVPSPHSMVHPTPRYFNGPPCPPIPFGPNQGSHLGHLSTMPPFQPVSSHPNSFLPPIAFHGPTTHEQSMSSPRGPKNMFGAPFPSLHTIPHQQPTSSSSFTAYSDTESDSSTHHLAITSTSASLNSSLNQSRDSITPLPVGYRSSPSYSPNSTTSDLPAPSPVNPSSTNASSNMNITSFKRQGSLQQSLNAIIDDLESNNLSSPRSPSESPIASSAFGTPPTSSSYPPPIPSSVEFSQPAASAPGSPHVAPSLPLHINVPFSLPPRPAGNSKKPIEELEKEDHARYIYGFRVQVCQGYMDGNCPYDSYTCFHTHSKQPRRRKPQLQHGRFNYIPTRCRYVLEEKECPQTIHCRFAHVTEEVIYHPSKYKTQLCTHQLDKDGNCSGYGMHCAKAHGEEDRRAPVFETTDEEATKATPDEYWDYVCPPEESEPERKFYMYVYKTKKCEGFPWNCECNGMDYHRDEERRRGPDIPYQPMACPNVKPYLNAEWGDPNVDCKGTITGVKPIPGQPPPKCVGWDCDYAHTLLELMYHPQVYKTGLCDHFDEYDVTTWKCVWKRRCAHAHGKDDVRTKEEAAEEWKIHLQSLNITPPPQRSPSDIGNVILPGCSSIGGLLPLPSVQDSSEIRNTVGFSGSSSICESFASAAPSPTSSIRTSPGTLPPLPSTQVARAKTQSQEFFPPSPSPPLSGAGFNSPSIRGDQVNGSQSASPRQNSVLQNMGSNRNTPTISLRQQTQTQRMKTQLLTSTSTSIDSTLPSDVQSPVVTTSKTSELFTGSTWSTPASSEPCSVANSPRSSSKPRLALFGLAEDSVWTAPTQHEGQKTPIVGSSPMLGRSSSGVNLNTSDNNLAINSTLLASARRLEQIEAKDRGSVAGTRSSNASAVGTPTISSSLSASRRSTLSIHSPAFTPRSASYVGALSSSPSASISPMSTVMTSTSSPSLTYSTCSSTSPSIQSFTPSSPVIGSPIVGSNFASPCRSISGARTSSSLSTVSYSASLFSSTSPDTATSPVFVSPFAANSRSASVTGATVSCIASAAASTTSSSPSVPSISLLSNTPALLPPSSAKIYYDSSIVVSVGRDGLCCYPGHVSGINISMAVSNSTCTSSTTNFDNCSNNSFIQRKSSPLLSPLLSSLSSSTASSVSSSSVIPAIIKVIPKNYPHLWDANVLRQQITGLIQYTQIMKDTAYLTPYIHWQEQEHQLVVALAADELSMSKSAFFSMFLSSSKPPTYKPLYEVVPTLIPRDEPEATVSNNIGHIKCTRLLQQLFMLLRCLHTMNVVHGDVTPSSVMLTSDTWSIHVQDICRSKYPDWNCQQIYQSILDKECKETKNKGVTVQSKQNQDHHIDEVTESKNATAQIFNINLSDTKLTADGGAHISHGASMLKEFSDAIISYGIKSSKSTTIDEAKARDIFSAACIGYYMFTSGRSPFCDDDLSSSSSSATFISPFNNWRTQELSGPIDTSSLSPAATHFLLHLLYTPSSTRMSADQALRHPIFWSKEYEMRFLCMVSSFILQSQAIQKQPKFEMNKRILDSVNDFTQELENLSTNIIPSCSSSDTSASQPDWVACVHSHFHQRYVNNISSMSRATIQSNSVLSLIHFMADLVNHLLNDNMIDCQTHQLLGLSHMKHCQIPHKDTNKTPLPSSSPSSITSSTSCNPPSTTDVLRAVASYFLQLFPSLLISTHHLVSARWKQTSTFSPFFSGTLPPLIPIPPQDQPLTSEPTSTTDSNESSTSRNCCSKPPINEIPASEPVIIPDSQDDVLTIDSISSIASTAGVEPKVDDEQHAGIDNIQIQSSDDHLAEQQRNLQHEESNISSDEPSPVSSSSSAHENPEQMKCTEKDEDNEDVHDIVDDISGVLNYHNEIECCTILPSSSISLSHPIGQTNIGDSELSTSVDKGSCQTSCPIVQQLKSTLMCPISSTSSGYTQQCHILHEPVTLTCCNLTLCKSCVPNYIQNAKAFYQRENTSMQTVCMKDEEQKYAENFESKFLVNEEKNQAINNIIVKTSAESKDINSNKAETATVVGRCPCGHTLNESGMESLRMKQSNLLLSNIINLMESHQ